MSLDLEQAFDSAIQALDTGGTMDRVAALLAENATAPEAYRGGFEALAASFGNGRTTPLWEDPENARDFFTRLLLQRACDFRPYIFHHGLASLLTSGNAKTARQIVEAMVPAVSALLLEAEDKEPQALVLYLLVARSILPKVASGALASLPLAAMHARHFRHFRQADFALPYSEVFNPEAFKTNCDDLRAFFPTVDAALDPEAGLGLSHLLLLTWLGGFDGFSAGDTTALQDALDARRAQVLDDPEELAAARTFVMRNWPRGQATVPLPTWLGLDDTALALTVGAASAGDSPAALKGLRHLESRGSRFFNVARTRAAAVVPALAGRRKTRVAVCVSGQLRGWQTALSSWRKTGFLAGAQADVFVHTWDVVGGASAMPARKELPFEGEAFRREWRRVGAIEGFDGLKARYPALFAALNESVQVDPDALKAAYGAKKVVVENEKAQPFDAFTNQDKMHYKLHAAHALAVEAGEAYDLVVRIRPDLPIKMVGFDWTDMAAVCRAYPRLYCDNPFGVHYGDLMIGDQFAIGAPGVMGTLVDSWTRNASLAALGLTRYPKAFRGHVTLALNAWLCRLETVRAPIKFGGLQAPSLLSLTEIHDAVTVDSDGRRDTLDEALLAAVTQDLKG